MFKTPYANNTRKVSGNVIVRNDDVVLLCDTFDAAVTINLMDIPYNHWNTIYKLYIIDNSNKAATNNITIVAGVGQTINGEDSIKIDTNGGIALVRVSSNASYLATLSNQSSNTSSGYNRIQDEGINLTKRQILNFIGENVTVTDDPANQRTNVTITGLGIVSLTDAEMLALIAAGTVVPGQFYIITDGGNSDLGVLVQGVTTKSTTVNGAGLFLNADYQGVGNYSSVPTKQSCKGIWSPYVSTVMVGDVVIYDNYNWLNLTGNWGSAPSSDTTNWAQLPKNVTKGYILVVDPVRFDVYTNVIRYRADKQNNEVEYYNNGTKISTEAFQWGREGCQANKVLENSLMDCTNSSAIIFQNTMIGAYMNDTTTTESPGLIRYNIMEPTSRITSAETQGAIERNRLIGSETRISITTLLDSSSDISDNELAQDSSIVCVSAISASYIRKNTLRASNIQVDYLENGVIQQCFMVNQSNILTASGSNKKIYLGDITRMNLSSGNFYFDYITSASVTDCNISNGTVNIVDTINSLSLFQNRTYQIGYSNWPHELNLSTNISGTELQLPYNWIGELTLTNCAAYTITAIGGAGAQTNHPVKIIGTTTGGAEIFTILPQAVGSAGPNDIVANSYNGGSGSYQPRTTVSDYAVVKAGYPANWILIDKQILI